MEEKYSDFGTRLFSFMMVKRTRSDEQEKLYKSDRYRALLSLQSMFQKTNSKFQDSWGHAYQNNEKREDERMDRYIQMKQSTDNSWSTDVNKIQQDKEQKFLDTHVEKLMNISIKL